MSKLTRKERLKVLEMATKVAAEAAGNTNVVWMIEFQEELIERLYRKMSNLLLEGEKGSDERDKRSKRSKRERREEEHRYDD